MASGFHIYNYTVPDSEMMVVPMCLNDTPGVEWIADLVFHWPIDIEVAEQNVSDIEPVLWIVAEIDVGIAVVLADLVHDVLVPGVPQSQMNGPNELTLMAQFSSISCAVYIHKLIANQFHPLV